MCETRVQALIRRSWIGQLFRSADALGILFVLTTRGGVYKTPLRRAQYRERLQWSCCECSLWFKMWWMLQSMHLWQGLFRVYMYWIQESGDRVLVLYCLFSSQPIGSHRLWPCVQELNAHTLHSNLICKSLHALSESPGNFQVVHLNLQKGTKQRQGRVTQLEIESKVKKTLVVTASLQYPV